MERTGSHGERRFRLTAVGSAYATGYEVYLENGSGQACSAQFRVHLNGAMALVPVLCRLSGRMEPDGIEIAKAIVADELASNPTPFHVLANGGYERDRLRRSIREAKGLRKIPGSDPSIIAAERRVADLERIILNARAWCEVPSGSPFAEFMLENEIAGNRRRFDPAGALAGDGEFRFHSVMGPIELLRGVMGMEDGPASILVVSEADGFDRVRPAAGERRDYDWPSDGPGENGGDAVIYLRSRFPAAEGRFLEALSEDAVVVGWTRRTETAAFNDILGAFAVSDSDPRIVLGSPEGTFSGRVSAIRNALRGAVAESLVTDGHGAAIVTPTLSAGPSPS